MSADRSIKIPRTSDRHLIDGQSFHVETRREDALPTNARPNGRNVDISSEQNDESLIRQVDTPEPLTGLGVTLYQLMIAITDSH